MQIGNSHSVNGLNNAYQNLQKTASEIASAETLSNNETLPNTEALSNNGIVPNKKSNIQMLVELKEAEVTISSLAKVVETEKDLLGIILDTKA